MRTLLLFGLLAVVAVAAGCNSNGSPGNLTGWNQAGLISGAVTPTPPTISTTGAVYGMTSNVDLTAGTFTVTTPDGKVVDVVLASTAKVLYNGGTTDVGSSVLTDGLNVTVTGTVTGLPSQSKVRAQLVIINLSESNQTILKGGSN